MIEIAEVTELARALLHELDATHDKLVLAESCTGGLTSALITRIPGASKLFCGSLAVYREATKTDWLSISQALIEENSAVDKIIAENMAKSVLTNTPEATIAGAVTGYLGPDSLPGRDGDLFIALAWRKDSKIKTSTQYFSLPELESSPTKNPEERRINRQVLASQLLIKVVRSLLNNTKNERR